MPVFAEPVPSDLPILNRSLAVAAVVLVHTLVLWSWFSEPHLSMQGQREMSVSLAMPSPPRAAPVEPRPKPVSKPEPKPEPVETQPAEPEQPIEQETPAEVQTAPAQPAAAPLGPPDREPDYQAAYLNNPKPGYPMVARRMGWQGRVTLEVEVLENGLPGQIKLHQSSGRKVLDKAAIQTVRGWRFVAARKSGREVVQRIFVPINFNLKESR